MEFNLEKMVEFERGRGNAHYLHSLNKRFCSTAKKKAASSTQRMYVKFLNTLGEWQHAGRAPGIFLGHFGYRATVFAWPPFPVGDMGNAPFQKFFVPYRGGGV